MLPATIRLCALSILLASCGDLQDEIRKAGQAEAFDPKEDLESKETNTTATDNNKPMCLSDCDNESWKYLAVDEMKLPNFTAPDGCTLGTSAAFAAAPDIDIMTIVNCAGTSRLYLWRVNTTGSVVRVPQQIAQCPLSQFLGNLRRQSGATGVLTHWHCTDGNGRYPTNRVRFENNAGVETWSTIVTQPSSTYEYNSEIGYIPEADMWGVVTGWYFQRFKSTGPLSGVTILTSTSPRNVISRYGTFQIASGSDTNSISSCTRVSTAGGLLCNLTSYANWVTSGTPVEGSNLALLQFDNEARAGTDSPAGCAVSVKASTTFRHNRRLNFIRSIASEGTPYAAALAIDKTSSIETLVLSLFEINSTLATVNHLISLPLGNSTANMGLFRIGERIYATWSEDTNVKIVSIPKPEIPK
jgi:hypothetical protein